MRTLKHTLIGTALLLGAACQAHASTISVNDIMGQFNAVVANKFTSGHDVEGRLVANEMTGGATFYNNPRGAASSFAAINAITIDNFNANINNGGSVDYQSSNSAHFNLNGGGHISQSPAFAMTDFTAPLNALALQLDALAANSTVNASDPNQFTFNVQADASGMAVFDISTSQLSNARNILFNGSANTIIINVSGTSFYDTANFNANAAINSHVIWNFIDATNLSFTSWHGAILAGQASVTNSSAMEGFLYANNFTGNGELHDYGFAGTLPPTTKVPEPGTPMLLAAGLLAIGALARRRTR